MGYLQNKSMKKEVQKRNVKQITNLLFFSEVHLPFKQSNYSNEIRKERMSVEISCEERRDPPDAGCPNYCLQGQAPPEEYDTCSIASQALSKIASSASVSSIPSIPEYDVKANESVSVIKARLSELIKLKGPSLMQACQNFDRRTTRRIPKSQLRQVIRMFCFPISAAQFYCICEELRMDSREKINYHKFFSELSGSKVPKVKRSLQKIPENVPIDEVELKIKEKVKANLLDVIRSFWLFDMNKDGLVQKADLRRIIKNYCFDINDDIFDDLWKSYDPKGTGIIPYRDFLVKLGVNADRYKQYMPNAASSLCWNEDKKKQGVHDSSSEQKCKRAALENRDDPAIQGLPLEEIAEVFVQRIRKKQQVLKSAFSVFDDDDTGQIPLSYFRGVINFFVLAMSSRLFNAVMKQLNVDLGAESLDYKTFLKVFCEQERRKSSERDREKLDVVCAPIVQRIRNRILHPEARLKNVFTKINIDQEWEITRPEARKAVELGLGFKLSDEEFKELVTILDPGNTNIIKCADFIHLFEDSCDTICIRKEDFKPAQKKIDPEKYRNLKGKRLKSKLKHHLNKNITDIEKAILVCDSDQSGFIDPEKLKDILSTFCFPLSGEQFQDACEDVRKYGERINYHEFLTLFKKAPHEDTQRWTAIVDKLVDFKSKCPPEMPVSEMEELLRDCVKSRKTAMLGDFRALDPCNVGIVCKDDARLILSKFAFRLTDEQFEAIWQTFPLNQWGQLCYDEFLDEYSYREGALDNQAVKTEEKQSSSKEDSKAERKVSFQKPMVRSSKGVRKDATVKSADNRKTAKEIFYSRAPQLKKIFESMEPTIVRNFRSILFHLRRADPKLTDTVDFITLKRILAKSDIYFAKEDEFHILEYFDTNLTGKINYRAFLRIFVWYA